MNKKDVMIREEPNKREKSSKEPKQLTFLYDHQVSALTTKRYSIQIIRNWQKRDINIVQRVFNSKWNMLKKMLKCQGPLILKNGCRILQTKYAPYEN